MAERSLRHNAALGLGGPFLEQRLPGRAGAARTYAGTVEFTGSPGDEVHPYDVTVELGVDEFRQRMVCTAVTFRQREGGPPVEAARIRGVSIPEYRDRAARVATVLVDEQGRQVFGRRLPRTIGPRAMRPGGRSQPVPVAEQVTLAADVYRDTRGDYEAVVAALRRAGVDVTKDVARKRIERARREGLLPAVNRYTRPRL